MFGKRFSISASSIAFAGACTVMLASPIVYGQGYYQQTGFPGYGRPQISGLSAAATQPPAFSDTSIDASAMSPDSWGESALGNPYAGYNNTRRSPPNTFGGYGNTANATILNATVPDATLSQARAFAQQQTQPTLVLNSTLSGASDDALTNTQYSRSARPPQRYADASFEVGKENQIAKPPLLPAVEFPEQQELEGNFDQLRLEAPTESAPASKSPAATFEGVITPEFSGPNTKAKATEAQIAPPPSQRVQPPTQRAFAQEESVLAPAQSDPIQAPSAQSQVAPTEPVTTRSGYPLFTPTQDQPTYELGEPQSFPNFFAEPSNGMISNGMFSNEAGFIYPLYDQGQNQVYPQTFSPIFDQGFAVPNYRSNPSHRSGSPTIRNQTILDQGESFDHENKKKEFPPFGEIIAQGRFFGSLEVALLRPHFLGNTAISIDGPTFSESVPFDFDNETAPHVRFGFESKYGPGFELNYFTLNANSESVSQAFDGVSTVSTIASVTGPNRFTQLSADVIGETLNANHSFEIETIGFNVFKDIAFKVSRIGGRFGFTYANIAQSLEATVTDGGGNVLGSLDNTTDFRGFGPQLGIDYYRPVGHTPFEFVTSFTGLGLFGRRDQFVNNTTGLVERRFGADEFIAKLDLTSGLQYKKTVAENRAWFARLAFVHQTWLGGGTAVDPTGDFGLKGVTFGVGYNR